ncbi:uncharacterized protein LOC130939767 [Arachis stenosperma]|uniref:uncharacterized protein LOC130939767 n=1 Tax=Arachis stenosperma TaxID=217475 RepID=UPI0025AD5331|nr:uncharacterized protein LOC130939767 [Arachis stenosperma]
MNDKKPTENDEASSKNDATLNKDGQEKPEEGEKQPQISRKGKQIMEESSQGHKQVEKTFTPPLPYPQRFNKKTKDQYFPIFLEVFKKLKIISKKRSCHEKETIMLTQECSAVIQRGASINLIPYSMMRKLCIEEVKPTQMSLELVDKSLVFPKGVIKNLLVKVDKFIFPADFVILDLGEEGSDSIILGRPFLATTRAIIDVKQREFTLRVHDERITLNVFPEAQSITEKESCIEVDKEDL